MFVSDCLANDDLTDHVMILASKDLDWEVKRIAFKYFSKHINELLDNYEKDSEITEVIECLNDSRILEGLQIITQDYEKALQNECYFFLKSLKTKLLQKYPTAIDELMTKYRANSAKKQKLQVDFLIDILNGINYGEKLENYEDYCEHHYGFISVLTDIIQVDAHESNIDTIDCF